VAEENARDDYTYQSSSRVVFYLLREAQLCRERKHMTMLEVVSSQRQGIYVNSVKHGTPTLLLLKGEGFLGSQTVRKSPI
jgi:hypothetical protein